MELGDFLDEIFFLKDIMNEFEDFVFDDWKYCNDVLERLGLICRKEGFEILVVVYKI